MTSDIPSLKSPLAGVLLEILLLLILLVKILIQQLRKPPNPTFMAALTGSDRCGLGHGTRFEHMRVIMILRGSVEIALRPKSR